MSLIFGMLFQRQEHFIGKRSCMKQIIRQEVLRSNSIAIADDKGNRITYMELVDNSFKIEKYIEERCFIFLLCDHQIETMEFLFEILLLNRVALLLPFDISGELLENLISIYSPQYIYCNKNHEVCDKYQWKRELVNHILLSTNKKKYEIHSDIAVLLSTSGTTGSPKLVKLSYTNLCKNAEYICSHLDIQKGQKALSPLLASYVYGLNFCIWHWHCGATLLVTDEIVLSKRFEEFYMKEKVNNFAGTPFIYQMMQKIRFWDAEKLEYLHWSTCAGSQLPEKDQNFMASTLGEKFWILYGQSESTGVVAGMRFGINEIRSGTVGRTFGDIKATVDDITKELLLKSNEVISMGYVNNIEQMREGDKSQEILHTGDRANIDKDGYIYLRGRMSRYVKVLDKRIDLDDVEKYLNSKLSGREFVCVGEDNHILVFSTLDSDSLNQEIPILLDRYMKIPCSFITCVYIKDIPRNSAGKISYAELRKQGKEFDVHYQRGHLKHNIYD